MLQPKKTTNGLTAADNEVLVRELTKYAEEGASDDELKEFRDTFISEKKKTTPKPATSTSTTPRADMGSVQKPGSSGFQLPDERLQNRTVNDNTMVAGPRRITTDVNKLRREDEAFKQLVKPKLASYRASTKITDQDENEARQELDAVKNERGVLNTIKSIAGQAVNFFTEGGFKKDDPLENEKEQAKQELVKLGEKKLTPELINKKAEEIFVRKKLDERKQQKVNDFMDGFDEQEKSYLEADAGVRYKTLSRKTKELSDRINLNTSYAEALLDDMKDPSMTEADRKAVMDEIQDIAKQIDEDYKLYATSDEELGSAEEEFDAFKRNYGRMENFGARALASVADLGVNVIAGAELLGRSQLGGGMNPSDADFQEGISRAKEGLSEFKEEFRPDNEDFNLGNFLQYSTDLLAGQTGNILALATTGGTAGATTLGVGAAGQKYNEMYNENKKGAGYSPLQMAVAPLVSGASEALFSELPTVATLRNTGRVWKAAMKDAATKELADQAIKNTAGSILKRAGRDLSKELATESINNVIQNAVNRDILGQNVDYFDNSWDVLKDTAILTTMISTAPAIGMAGIKKMTTPENKMKLDENGKKIIALARQLDNPELDDTTKGVIESQINKATKESSSIVKETLDKIDEMPDSDVKAVVNGAKKMSDITEKANSVRSSTMPEGDKAIVLKGLEQEYKKVRERTDDIINNPANKEKAKKEKEIKKNEEIQSKSPQPDGEVRPEPGIVGEEGIAVEQSSQPEVVSDSIVAEPGQGDVEVTKAPTIEYEGQSYRIDDGGDVLRIKNGEEYLVPVSSPVAKAVKKLAKSEAVSVRKEKRIAAADAKIDDIANWLKEALPSAKINSDDYKAMGFSQDQVIDLLAKGAKALVETGIEIDEAVRQAIAKLQERFEIDVDENEVKALMSLEPSETKTSSSSPTDGSLEELSSYIPKKGEVKDYLSGDTIKKYQGGDLNNDQEYVRQELAPALEHGVKLTDSAKEKFGDDYVGPTLDYIDSLKDVQVKALMYVSLENDIASRRASDPENLQLQKEQDLVREKSQAFARSASIAINFGRLRKFAEAGYDLTQVTDRFFSPEQRESRKTIEKAIQSDGDAINREAELLDEDAIQSMISEGVEKEIDAIYKSLPTNRRKKADKAIAALEKIQKNLRANRYSDAAGAVVVIDAGITTIKMAIRAGVEIADAVELGIQKIKELHKGKWENEDRFRKDMLSGFRSEGIETKREAKGKNEIKDQVKQALIEKGYGREITVSKLQTNEDGSVTRVKEKKQTLDWKKLAGEEGSVERIRKNVEEVLKEKGWSQKQIESMREAYKDEYENLRASIIEKSINELQNRNKVRTVKDPKSSAKRLAELYNMGLFDKPSHEQEFDRLINSALGLSGLGQSNFEKAKALAKQLADLYATKEDGRQISEIGLKHAIREINRNIENLLASVAWKESNGAYKAAIMAKEYTGLAQRAMLQSVKQLVENPLSGGLQRLITKIGYAPAKTSNPELRRQRKELTKAIYSDIVRNGGTTFGDVTTPIVNKSQIEEKLNQLSDNRLWHVGVSTMLGRAFLEGADSMHKANITERYFAHNLIKILTHSSNPNRMSKKDALEYVTEQLTGQNFEDAKKTAQELIDGANKEKKTLPDNKEAVLRLANDLVKDSLLKNGKLSLDEIKSAYEAAYTSAGFDLGHEANNFLSVMVSSSAMAVEGKLAKAVKEKKWNEAAVYAFASIITKNILNPFVSGGTNWLFLTLQKSGMDPISPIIDYVRHRSNKIDVSTEEGMKNLENALVRNLNSRGTAMRMLIGGMANVMIAGAAVASGAYDDMDEWLKENQWAEKYFKVFSPQMLILMLSAKNEELGAYFSQLLGMKFSGMTDAAKLTKAAKSFDKGDTDKASGQIGSVVGGKLSSPGPWRMYRDVDNIIRGLNGKPQYTVDPNAEGFTNGLLQGGLIEYLGLRPDLNGSGESAPLDQLTPEQQERRERINAVIERARKRRED